MRHSTLPRPTGSPRPSRRARQPRGPQTDATAPVPVCRADEYFMNALPGFEPMGEAGLNSLMKMWGADTPEKREACLKGFNDLTEQNIQRRGIRIIGVKPKAGDQGVFHVRIPNSPLAIRMWEGGMGPYGQFCFDFYDVQHDASVNLPHGHSLHLASVPVPPAPQFHGLRVGPAYPPPGFPSATNAPQFNSASATAGSLRSWERNMGMREIPDGEEKWMMPQGAYVTLKRAGHADVVFQIPTLAQQPAFAVLPTHVGPPL